VKPRRRLLAFAGLVAAVAVAACGTNTLKGSSLEAQIEKSLASKAQEDGGEVEVRCPREIKLQAMAKLDCPASVGKTKGVVVVTQQDDQGNVRYQYRQRFP